MPKSTISFPTNVDPQTNNYQLREGEGRSTLTNFSNLSLVSVHNTSIEVCYSVYGDSSASVDAVERFYEPNAVYENPFLTATSRSAISDIFRLSRHFGVVDIPRPLSMLHSLFRLSQPNERDKKLFQALRAWTDIGDISESESFDGHRRTIIEHNLNVLILPGIHNEESAASHNSSDSLTSPTSAREHQYHMTPSLHVPGTSLSLPSPFHISFHITSKLSFNEQGKITHHRDFWDVKDVMGLVPGVPLAQWIATRLAARGLSYVARSWITNNDDATDQGAAVVEADLERGVSPAAASRAAARDGK